MLPVLKRLDLIARCLYATQVARATAAARSWNAGIPGRYLIECARVST